MIGQLSAKRCGICKAQLRAVAIKADALMDKTFAKAAPIYVCPNCDGLK